MAKKESIGYLAVISSALLLSLELYSLNFVQYIDMEINGSCYTKSIDYIFKLPISLAFLVTIAITILGVILIVQCKKDNKNNGQC